MIFDILTYILHLNKTMIPEKEDQLDYYCNRGWLSRHFLLLYTLDHVNLIRQQLHKASIGLKVRLSAKDLPKLLLEDTSEMLGQSYMEAIINMPKQKNLECTELCFLFAKQNTSIIIQALINSLMTSLLRLAFISSIIQLLIEIKNQNSVRKCNLIILITVLLFSEIIFGRSFVLNVNLLRSRISVAIMYITFQKMTNLSEYSLQLVGIGKIINMVSTDILKLDTELSYLFFLFCFPIIFAIFLVWVSLIMWHTFLLLIPISILVLLLQMLVGKIKFKYQQKYLFLKDQRINSLSQVLNSIKAIKMHCWQDFFNKKIEKIRNKQIFQLLKIGIGKSFQKSISSNFGNLSAFICFLFIYFIKRQDLSTIKILSLMFFVSFIQELVVWTSKGVSFLFDMKAMINRLLILVNSQNFQMVNIETDQQQQKVQNNRIQKFSRPNHISIKLTNFSCYWTKENKMPILRFINLQLEKGEFCGIFGEVGNGKTTLLLSLIREISFFAGELQTNGSISYVQQSPFVCSGTIKENILFGRSFETQLYKRAIECSCLIQDINNFQEGDQTFILQKGTNLSGGQKARISLARAIYANSDIYLLDDPFSAVDAKVGAKIYANTILKILKGKTIILVTHNKLYLRQCTKIISLKDGIMKNQLLDQFNQKQLNQNIKSQSQNFSEEKDASKILPVKLIKAKSIIKTEFNTKIEVTWNSYIKYLLYGDYNKILFLIVIGMLILSNIINIYFIRYLSSYDTQIQILNQDGIGITLFWNKLGILLIANFVLCFLQDLLFQYVILRSNQKLHNDMVIAIQRCKNSQFDILPSGFILTKFTTDISFLDTEMISFMTQQIQGIIMIGTLFISMILTNSYFIIVFIINIIAVTAIFRYCKESIIQSRKLDFQTRKTVFTIIRETVAGLIIYKLYNNMTNTIKKLSESIDLSTRCYISHQFTSRALDILLRVCCGFLFIFALLIGIYINKLYTVDSFGACLIFLIKINTTIPFMLRNFLKVETSMMHVESILTLINMPFDLPNKTKYDKKINTNKDYNQLNSIEAQDKDQDADQSKCIQYHHQIQIKNFSLRYRQDLPLILNNLNVIIKPFEKVGIVGRTGSGKSSLMLALLRMYEPSLNSIYKIKQFNATKVGLHTLRNLISIIPQNAFIFSGTVRQNIDPFYKYTDTQILDILKQCQLKDYILTLQLKLQSVITKSNQIFSEGQKQLVCLARSLLMNRDILLIDEATSNIDSKTDKIIQEVLKHICVNKTVITIAHRIQTICHYDKILVMDHGQIVQQGTPFQLINIQGLFRQMIRKTGKGQQIIKQICQKQRNKQKQN